MNIQDLTVNQLKRAAAIKEQIEALNKELRRILGAPTSSGVASTTNRSMSAAVKKKIAASQKARWVNLRRTKAPTRSVKPAGKTKKKAMSRATRMKLAAKLRAYWAAKKAAKR